MNQAANRLHVQQPVVSKMLGALDDQFGQPLFWKQGRSKKLTDFGQVVFRHCQSIFDEFEKVEQFSRQQDQISGVLNIGAAEPIVNHFLSSVCSDYMNLYPGVNVNLYTSTQVHLLSMISEGKMEVGFFFYIANMPGNVEVFKKKLFPFRLVVSKDKCKDKTVLQSFIGSREIDDTSTHKFPTLEKVKKLYPKTRITFSSNSISLHKQLVLAGNGISILPEFVVKKELDEGQLVDVFPDEVFEWEMLFAKRKSSNLSSCALKLLESI